MIEKKSLYIDGCWISPSTDNSYLVVDPGSEQPIARVALGSTQDVDKAVEAARRAFSAWSTSSSDYRASLILAIAEGMKQRKHELVELISITMGCPPHIAETIHVDGPIAAFEGFAQRAAMMDVTDEIGHSLVVREAAGVCAMINPWNYPLHQFVAKVAPALAAGCTMIVKPSEQTPLQDFLLAEIFDNAGVPAGVFNLVTGYGHDVGTRLAAHPDIDLISFTGSVRAGVSVASQAAASVKRVTQELGGKSPYIITADADLEAAVQYGVDNVMINSGQTCTALTRMIVPRHKLDEVGRIAKQRAESFVIGQSQESFLGPLSSGTHRDRVLDYIQIGIDEGATLVTGGLAMPEGHTQGYYVRPTIFSNVDNSMRIAREEIFGPVLCIIPYDTEEEAIRIANDSDYGLSSAVWAADYPTAMSISRQLRAGLSYVQGASFNYEAPFGGYKQSGNGREYGDAGMHEYIELKSIQGGVPANQPE